MEVGLNGAPVQSADYLVIIGLNLYSIYWPRCSNIGIRYLLYVYVYDVCCRENLEIAYTDYGDEPVLVAVEDGALPIYFAKYMYWY